MQAQPPATTGLRLPPCPSPTAEVKGSPRSSRRRHPALTASQRTGPPPLPVGQSRRNRRAFKGGPQASVEQSACALRRAPPPPKVAPRSCACVKWRCRRLAPPPRCYPPRLRAGLAPCPAPPRAGSRRRLPALEAAEAMSRAPVTGGARGAL